MNNSYKFFQNKECKYFPCHKIKDSSNFNCLFCYCPLYLLKDKCGGNFKYYQDIKDCSECTIVHNGEKAWDFVNNKSSIIIDKAKKKE